MGRELIARLEGERAAARALVAPALDARRGDRAKAEDIIYVHQTATAWKGQDLMPSNRGSDHSPAPASYGHPGMAMRAVT